MRVLECFERSVLCEAKGGNYRLFLWFYLLLVHDWMLQAKSQSTPVPASPASLSRSPPPPPLVPLRLRLRLRPLRPALKPSLRTPKRSIASPDL
jgi:hypothetical protein